MLVPSHFHCGLNIITDRGGIPRRDDLPWKVKRQLQGYAQASILRAVETLKSIILAPFSLPSIWFREVFGR